LRSRIAIALILVVLGIVLVAASIGELLVGHTASMNIIITGVLGAVLLIVGLMLLIAAILEAWMSRSQTALVDALQAG
jgi:uncharacterized membrane protein